VLPDGVIEGTRVGTENPCGDNVHSIEIFVRCRRDSSVPSKPPQMCVDGEPLNVNEATQIIDALVCDAMNLAESIPIHIIEQPHTQVVNRVDALSSQTLSQRSDCHDLLAAPFELCTKVIRGDSMLETCEGRCVRPIANQSFDSWSHGRLIRDTCLQNGITEYCANVWPA
jgi:hypothetical protein